jgi:hypothetical protein
LRAVCVPLRRGRELPAVAVARPRAVVVRARERSVPTVVRAGTRRAVFGPLARRARAVVFFTGMSCLLAVAGQE